MWVYSEKEEESAERTELLELEAVSLLIESVDSSTQMVLDILNVIMMLQTYTFVKHQKSWNESEVLAQGD